TEAGSFVPSRVSSRVLASAARSSAGSASARFRRSEISGLMALFYTAPSLQSAILGDVRIHLAPKGFQIKRLGGAVPHGVSINSKRGERQRETSRALRRYRVLGNTEPI